MSVDLTNSAKPNHKTGLKLTRRFTTPGQDPFSQLQYDRRTTTIADESGNIIAQISNVEVPSSWSQLATDILAYKYLRKAGVPTPEGRETSAKQAVHRISHTMADFGEKFGYFATPEDRITFEDELKFLLINQKAAFNSPVWFNCGLYHQYKIEGTNGSFYWDFKEGKVLETKNGYRNPQCSACFILSVGDSLGDIFELIKTESRIFKFGSGSGANFSRLRSRFERLSGGGTSSGMMSFLRVFDRAADAVKSGGTTRRAAKMVVVDITHPEIEEFIDWKVQEERKVQTLIDAGYSSDFNGEAYHTVSGQNSNNSVRLNDEFMRSYESDGEWTTRAVTSNEPYKTYKAKYLMDKIAKAAWQCADPGVQFDTIINKWHTCPNTGRINASNPCSEYMFLDDSACNLASINLVKFADDKGNIDIAAYRHACKIMFIAQEIAVDLSSYPTEILAKNSHDYRPLGLGFANLGTLLMLKGVAYDSPEGTAIGGALSAIMTGHAYKTSAEISAVKGPFAGFVKNRAPMLNVMQMHRSAAYALNERHCPTDLLAAAKQDWDEAVALGEQFGYRNAQATVIAPTGTIGLLMDCDTTGVEPDFAVVKFKKLAGGGSVKIVNSAVSQALANLGYDESQRQGILTYVLGTGSLEGSTPINRTSLSEKGLTESEIDEVAKILGSSFDINHAFNRHTLGNVAYERLGISEEESTEPGFSWLKKAGYSETDINQSNGIICGAQTLEGAPSLKDEHLKVFDCANKCGARGTRFIAPMAHVRMMAAVQPFISGAISKTINMPHEATVEEVTEVYIQSWHQGVKALALYRDGSKLSQPLNTKKRETDEVPDEPETKSETKVVYMPRRRRLPDERHAITHKFQIAGHEGYITVGIYDDGTPGEVFITMAKQGSLISGLVDAFATSLSIMLQYGVPVSTVVRKFINSRFDPYGFTTNPQIRLAKSIVDYIARYIGLKFLSVEDQAQLGLVSDSAAASSQQTLVEVNEVPPTLEDDEDAVEEAEAAEKAVLAKEVASDAPACPNCGSMTFKTGTCYTCLSCGSTTGGCS
ncbi:ribonucleoside-diphosphate reductase, adenosylcobalamin-dependent [Candidatus Berkelbacteria bacterium RIFCSPLOWO2_01_FULL_50_28]|uniref:Vitamin B12-dependent ribonucleotide reductase n=1 Tax=Candidatus Berkelbacteria bacterium RIFCSPLOWO2_01_FULL_50_28 TaxID=1797471 RepID=A0A1F5ECA8_9BACT|nr:MAG: ribonucleoside-diphosphate reductase, adenosylcobalamin-dependent [Candidatus Berkelbacteria bacterium RIFCSPHIGHO2_01_FULL_50_36]OGD65003.1 MAG: ribonucleoside-diphosphate reductase, adenosylcobalamin-dependent [Candidatus Berkelbacteria bacterium RIFCSPLOWO2_01_FULL_50_28]